MQSGRNSSPLTEHAGHPLGWRMTVLPFRTLGASAGLGIALGMAEEVSATLTRFCAARLISTATFWDGSGPAVDSMARCQAYGLDYIIDGTLQVVGDELHADITLLDVVLDFEVIWRGNFIGKLTDLFSLQDRIAFDVVRQVDPEAFHRVTDLDALVRTEVAAAHQILLTAIQDIFRLDLPTFMRARELLAQAIELDPEYAAAHGWMAYWSITAVGLGWMDNSRDTTTLAGASAERAIQLDPLDARALAVAGHVKAYLLHDVPSALRLHARAIELNPNLPFAWKVSSWSRIYSGEHSTAVRHAVMAQSLSPRDPHIVFVEHVLQAAQFFNRNLEEAEMVSVVVLERKPNHRSALQIRLATLGQLGRNEDARHCLELLRKIDPTVTLGKLASRIPLTPEDKLFYMEGLERAGVPR